MIGRAALGNPWIFDHVKSYCARGEYTPMTNAQRLSTVLEQSWTFARSTVKNGRSLN